MEGYAREGLSDVQIAEKMRISLTTYYDWQNKYPELSEAIKKGKPRSMIWLRTRC